MSYSLSEAAKASGKSKATIHRAIQSGRISATRDEITGSWTIDPAELHRVFSPVPPDQAQNGHLRQNETAGEMASLRLRLEELQQERERERSDKDSVIADLRQRLDASEEERRKVQAQLTTLLTDQRPEPVRRRWWQRWKATE
ncbi:MAG: DNA-binding protein [Acidobacteria bacterium]|nr:DNA-binding protein [Acidobacteriota bacterium]